MTARANWLHVKLTWTAQQCSGSSTYTPSGTLWITRDGEEVYNSNSQTPTGPEGEIVVDLPVNAAGLYGIFAQPYDTCPKHTSTAKILVHLDDVPVELTPDAHTWLRGEQSGCIWHICTVGIHKDGQTGEYRLIQHSEEPKAATEPKRDMMNTQGGVVIQATRKAFYPEAVVVTVDKFWGPNALDPVFLAVDQTAAFGAHGRYESYGHVHPISLLDHLDVHTIAGDNVCIIDDKGLLTGLNPGHVQVKCRNPAGGGYLSPPIDVYVIKVEFPITINVFIPEDNVANPDNWNIVFGGDGRSFDKNGSFRTQQKFTLVTFQEYDADGLKDGSYVPIAGESVSYDVGSYPSSVGIDGKLTAAAKADTVEGPPLKLEWDTESTSGMTVVPTRITDRKVKAVCTVEANNPLLDLGPLNSISYELTLTIDSTDPLHPTYSITGDFDGFPDYEAYIGDQCILQYDHGSDTPFSLGPPKEKTEANSAVPSSGDVTP